MSSHRPPGPFARSATALVLLCALLILPMLLIRPVAAAGPGGVTVYGGSNAAELVVPLEARSGVVEVVTGSFHVLVRKQDGSLLAWGRNTGGQLDIPNGLKDVTQLDASTTYSLALKDGGVIAWGKWADVSGAEPSSNPVTVPPEAKSGVAQVAAGATHIVALKNDGSVIEWGPGATAPVPSSLSSGVTQVAAGFGFSAALKDGKVTTWGPGVGRPNIAADDQLNENLTQIGAGNNFVIALTSTGTVVAWNLTLSPPTPINIVQISAGIFHAVGVTSDGRLVGWGANDFDVVSSLPPTSIANTPAEIQVDAGYAITVALAPLPPFTSVAPPVGTYGARYNHSFIATGATNFSLESGSLLPPGLALTPTGTLTGTPTAAGSYSFSVVAADNNGPVAAETFTLTIARAALVVRASDVTRKVGTPNPAVFAVTFEGWKLADDATVLTEQPTATVSGDTSAVGTYPIVPSGGAAVNYTLSYVNGTLTVTAKDVPTITWATPAAITYGTPLSATQLNATASVPGSFSYNPPLGAVLDAGTRTLQVIFTPTDQATYASVEKSVELSVAPRTLTVTANDASRRVGAPNPAFSVSYAGFAPGESAANLSVAPTATSAATPGDPVGSYPIVAIGGVSPNYSFVYVDGTLSVTKTPLRVTANNLSVQVGQPLPTLTFTVNPADLVNGDTPATALSGALATTATPTSSVGTYPITIGTLKATNNYELSFTEGTLSIVNDQSFVYLPLVVR